MAENERQIRAAAETLLTGSINSQRSSYTQSSVMRTPDIILNENLIAGAMQNGKMSNVRRFFCLFVTFDLLLTFLMWLICTMIAGDSLESAFINQVVHYHIKTSLFDIVMTAICRFTLLLLFYALLYLNHWIIVAMTTAITCAFLIAKVFLFDWSTCNQPVFQVLLILTSFVLPWVEAWFFDIRVLPQETQARNWFRNFNENEREPLLRGVTSRQQYTSMQTTGTFFTPVESADHSDNEDEATRRQEVSKNISKANEVFAPRSLPKLTSEMINDYKRKASVLVQECHNLLQSEDWQMQSLIVEHGDNIFYMDRPKPVGRIFKIEGFVDAPASLLVNHLFDDIESIPTWNKLVTESQKIQCIDENTDIVYQATSPQGGGMIDPRDFVILRHRVQYGNYYLSSGTSVPFSTLPSRSNIVRADNRISCWAAEKLPYVENRCRFTWILNTNLKGWIPQKIVDKSMSAVLVDFMCYIRKYAEELQGPSITA